MKSEGSCNDKYCSLSFQIASEKSPLMTNFVSRPEFPENSEISGMVGKADASQHHGNLNQTKRHLTLIKHQCNIIPRGFK